MPPGWPRRARSVDRLSTVPLHWRPTMEALIQGKNQVMQEPEEYPMAVQGESLQSAYEFGRWAHQMWCVGRQASSG
jgi:hypothetical protein